MTLTFKAWLLGQVDRSDPVGDLALDAHFDPAFPRDGTREDYREYLTKAGAMDAALEALEAGWAEFDALATVNRPRPLLAPALRGPRSIEDREAMERVEAMEPELVDDPATDSAGGLR